MKSLSVTIQMKATEVYTFLSWYLLYCLRRFYPFSLCMNHKLKVNVMVVLFVSIILPN